MDKAEADGMTSSFPPVQFRMYEATQALAQRGAILEGMAMADFFNECCASTFNTALALHKELVWLVMLDQDCAKMLLEHLDALWQ